MAESDGNQRRIFPWRPWRAWKARIAAKNAYVTPTGDGWKGLGWLKGLKGRTGIVVGGVFGLYAVVVVAVGWWWSYEPDRFDPVQTANARAAQAGVTPVTGFVTANTVAVLAETLLEKRGGYLSNDVFPPGLYLDNVPNWEFGVLVHLRDMSRALRNDLSRSQSQSAEDRDLANAQGNFFYDNASWIFPQSEAEYRDGADRVYAYAVRLTRPEAQDTQFYARADNLARWLQEVATRLGDLSQRLSQSVGKRQLNLGLASDPAAEMATDVPADAQTRTSWFAIDDVFFEARGQTWALIHLLKAVEHDFGAVLEDKNARVSLRQIIRELEATQEPIWSPMILNGGGFGFLANHSLVMASYVSRVNAALLDLSNLLARG